MLVLHAGSRGRSRATRRLRRLGTVVRNQLGTAFIQFVVTSDEACGHRAFREQLGSEDSDREPTVALAKNAKVKLDCARMKLVMTRACCPQLTPSALRLYILLLLAIMMDSADMSLLPAVYLDVCREFRTGPALIGTVTLCRGLAQALVSLAAGPLGNRYSRTRIVGLALITWGASTAGIGLARSVGQLMLARLAAGVGLGLAIPIINSLIADIFPARQRGRAFGLLWFMWNVGSLSGGLVAANLAARRFGGVSGWRVAFFGSAAISIPLGVVMLLVGRDPPRPPPPPLSCAGLRAELSQVLRVRSFRIIVLQGVPGSAPWYALGFFVMWLELRGFSHAAAARLRACFDAACAVGALAGGVVGDVAARRSPVHGRIWAAQLSVASGIPLWLAILFALPAVGAPEAAYGAALLLTGSLVAWCGGINSVLMAEVTPPHVRSTIYGLDRLLEGLLAPASTALVGLLAQAAFGFGGGGDGGDDGGGNADCSVDAAPDDDGAGGDGGGGGGDASDAAALARSLAILLVVPWSLCLAAYSLLHWTFAADRAAAAAAHAAKVGGGADAAAGGAAGTRTASSTSKAAAAAACGTVELVSAAEARSDDSTVDDVRLSV